MRTMAQTASLTLVANPYRVLLSRAIPIWVKQSGFRWASARCKEVIAYLAKVGAGEKPDRPCWLDSRYIKYPEKVARSGQTSRYLQIIQLWCLYTAFGDHQELEDSDVYKFLDAVRRCPSVMTDQGSDGRRSFTYRLVELFQRDDADFIDLTKKHWESAAGSLSDCIAIKDPCKRLCSFVQFSRDGQWSDPFSSIRPLATFVSRSRRVMDWESYESGFTRLVYFRKRKFAVPKTRPSDLFASFPRRVTKVPNIWSLQTHRRDGTLTQFGEEATGISEVLEELREYGIKLPYALSSIARPLWCDWTTPRNPRGVVHCRVQRNGKARFFYAAPHWAQAVLYPWAQGLYSWLKALPQDYTHDQEKGARQVQKWIREQEQETGTAEVWSIDLSSATDRMPLALTNWVLRNLQPKERSTPNWAMWCSTFGLLSRLQAENGFRAGHCIQWKVGQPLGLVASFAAFAITNHYLARLAHELCAMTVKDDSYAIVGDDIVFKHAAPAKAYSKMLTALGVEVSTEKSLKGRLAEFVGRLITADDIEFKLKFESVPSLRTLRSRIDLIGPRALKMFKPSLMRDLIAMFPTSRTPLGLNPGGFSRAARQRFWLAYAFLEPEPSGLDDPRVRSSTAISAMMGISSLWSGKAIDGAHNISSTDGYDHEDILMGRQTLGTSSELVWKYSSYSSRAFLTRIRKAAHAAGIVDAR